MLDCNISWQLLCLRHSLYGPLHGTSQHQIIIYTICFFDEMFCDYTALLTLIYSFVFCCMRCIGLIKCLHILAQDKSVSSFLRQL